MKNILIFCLTFLSPDPAYHSSSEFYGFLENGDYCYKRTSLSNDGNYHSDIKHSEFVVRNSVGKIVRMDTLWVERTNDAPEYCDIIPYKRNKSNIDIPKFLTENRVSTQNINLVNSLIINNENVELKLWKGDLYLLSKNKKDSTIIYNKKQNFKNVTPHLDGIFQESHQINRFRLGQIISNKSLFKEYLSQKQTVIKAVYFHKNKYLIHIIWGYGYFENSSNEDLDVYFTIPQGVLEKSLQKIYQK